MSKFFIAITISIMILSCSKEHTTKVAPKGDKGDNESNYFESSWFAKNKNYSKVNNFFSALNRYKSEGLNPEHYNYSFLLKELSKTDLDLNQLRQLLDKSFLEFITDLTKGQVDPLLLGSGWERSDMAERINYNEIQENFFTEEEFDFNSLLPQSKRFQKLKLYLQKYETILHAGGWEYITQDVEPQNLAKRLKLTGDYEGEISSPILLEDALSKALAKFQLRHGLLADGVLGGKTLTALNVPVESRIEQIKVNLERWKWLTRNLESIYVEVNIPDYQLRIYEQDRLILKMRAIVGKPTRPTPILRSDIIAIEVNPDWDVPVSIAAHEILPLLKKDPEYLSKNHMIVLAPDGTPVIAPTNWGSFDATNFPYRLRQLPGSWNSVGPIKFQFFNRYGVFLHGTPAKNLFSEIGRGFSHGCIRVEDPLKLAKYIFSENARSNEIEDTLASGKTELFMLKKKIALYLSYWTAWVDENELLHFAADVYGGDEALNRAIKRHYQRAGQPRTST